MHTRTRFVPLISPMSCGTVVKIKWKKIDASTQDGRISRRWPSRDRRETTRTRGECNNKLKYGFQISCPYFIMDPRGRWRVTAENPYNIVRTVLQPLLPSRTIPVFIFRKTRNLRYDIVFLEKKKMIHILYKYNFYIYIYDVRFVRQDAKNIIIVRHVNAFSCLRICMYIYLCSRRY